MPSPATAVPALLNLPPLPALLVERVTIKRVEDYSVATDARATTITMVLQEILEQRPIPHGGIND